MARHTYPESFKRDAVDLVRNGTSVEQVAQELAIPNGTVWHWVEEAGIPNPGSTLGDTTGMEATARAELRRARKRIAELEAENEFLGKVTAYFAQKERHR